MQPPLPTATSVSGVPVVDLRAPGAATPEVDLSVERVNGLVQESFEWATMRYARVAVAARSGDPALLDRPDGDLGGPASLQELIDDVAVASEALSDATEAAAVLFHKIADSNKNGNAVTVHDASNKNHEGTNRWPLIPTDEQVRDGAVLVRGEMEIEAFVLMKAVYRLAWASSTRRNDAARDALGGAAESLRSAATSLAFAHMATAESAGARHADGGRRNALRTAMGVDWAYNSRGEVDAHGRYHGPNRAPAHTLIAYCMAGVEASAAGQVAALLDATYGDKRAAPQRVAVAAADIDRAAGREHRRLAAAGALKAPDFHPSYLQTPAVGPPRPYERALRDRRMAEQRAASRAAREARSELLRSVKESRRAKALEAAVDADKDSLGSPALPAKNPRVTIVRHDRAEPGTDVATSGPSPHAAPAYGGLRGPAGGPSIDFGLGR